MFGRSVPVYESDDKASSAHWLISTQVDSAGNVLDGERPSPKTDALRLLDPAYADAGTEGGSIFRGPQGPLAGGLWGALLYKDTLLNGNSKARRAAVVAFYQPWLPPWARSRKRSRS